MGRCTQAFTDHPYRHSPGPSLVLRHDLSVTTVAGRWFYLFLCVGLYSRKAVGWEVCVEDDSDHATCLVQRTALAEGIAAKDSKPELHGDNGATLKVTTVLAMLLWVRGKPPYSRPRVSDDNAFVEALFRTAQYRPEYPKRGFTDLSDARDWAARFVRWYNLEHRHSGIRYVTPAQRHSGQDVEILKRRDELYQQARQCHPGRWARHTRNWDHIAVVKLNPERDSEPIETPASALDKAPRRA